MRDRLRRQGRRASRRSSQRAGRRWSPPRATDARRRAARTDARRPEDHARRRTSSSAASCASRPPTATSSTPTCTSRTAAASTACSSSSTGGTQELAHDIAVHIAFAKPHVPHPRRGARRRGRRRSAQTLETITRNEGKPEQALAEDRRGPAQRLLQGRRACSSRRFVKDDEADDRPASLGGGRPIVRFAQVEIGELSSVAGDAASRCRWQRVVLKLSGEAFAERRPATASTATSSSASPREIAEVAQRARRRDRRRRRRRQHLAGHDRRRRAAWTAPRPTTWACSPRSSTRWRCRTRSSSSASRPGCRPRSRWRRSPSRTSRAGPSATSRRAGS